MYSVEHKKIGSGATGINGRKFMELSNTKKKGAKSSLHTKNKLNYLTASTIALNASGLLSAKSASTFLFKVMPLSATLPIKTE